MFFSNSGKKYPHVFHRVIHCRPEKDKRLRTYAIEGECLWDWADSARPIPQTPPTFEMFKWRFDLNGKR
jgi:hypothetical protein